jgi:hypothetical protein
MYEFALLLHSWLRWTALLTAVIATVMALSIRPGVRGSDHADRWGLILMIELDLQMLLGLVLYLGLSPTTSAIFNDFGAAMGDPVARYWAVEHITMMVGAVVLAHLGRILARKAISPASKRFRLSLCFGVATLLMLLGTPWPGMTAGRPLFRI